LYYSKSYIEYLKLLYSIIIAIYICGDSPNSFYDFRFQDPASANFESIIELYHGIMFFLVIIAVFVMYLLVKSVVLFNYNGLNLSNSFIIERTPTNVVHNTPIELI
jgi:heme/copper-type cytochrome/quinol oxidase subunit 2